MQRTVWEQLTHKTFTLPGPPPALLKELALPSTILDVGCGYGRLLQAPELQAYQLIGVDGAVGMLRRAHAEGVVAPLAAMDGTIDLASRQRQGILWWRAIKVGDISARPCALSRRLAAKIARLCARIRR